ncbi:MAG TPA: hypothetical protein VKA90_01470 [Beijerinckiaceae bacterium]|nr:hypothetical protein [Beijerinckiaceae bacterium]
MQQNATLRPDGTDAGTPTAVPDVARRSGLTPDEWVVAPGELAGSDTVEGSPARRSRTAGSSGMDDLEAAVARLTEVSRGKSPSRGARDLESLLSFAMEGERRARENALKTATALDSVTRWIARAEDRLNEASRAAFEDRERTAAALKAVERVEERLSKTAETSLSGRNEHIEAVLRGFEKRIAHIDERLAALSARPIGRRGLDARDEVKNAVAEIRSRQSELETGTGVPARSLKVTDSAAPPARTTTACSNEDALRSLNEDIAKLASRLETARPVRTDFDVLAVGAIRDEMGRLQASIAGLATRDEVGAIERSILAFAERVASTRNEGDVEGVKALFEALQTEVRRLSGAVASGLPGRLTSDIEHLTRKIDAVAGTGVNPSVVEALSREIAEMRRVLADRAEPRRIEDLSRLMAELSAQVAEVATRQVDVIEFSSLKSSIEEIRSALKGARPEGKGSADYSQRFDRLTQDIEHLSNRVDGALPGNASALGADAVLQRLDRLDENLRSPLRGDDLKPIEELLRSLLGKLEQAERSGAGSDTLDALERQVATLAERIEKAPSGSDPALATLERAMGDLMAQVEGMRDDTFQAVEQAARTAVADTLGAAPATLGGADFSAFERDLADIKAYHSASDKRTHDTLAAVQLTLEQVVTRLANLEKGGGAPGPTIAAPPLGGDPVRPLDPRAVGLTGAAFSSDLSDADRAIAAPSADEILLEPGAARPGAEPSGKRGGASDASAGSKVSSSVDASAGDVKATFIAAARRAAQAAAAEAAIEAKGASRLPNADRLSGGKADTAGLLARTKTLTDKRRRPILLGLAAVVLAIGALQATGGLIRGGSKLAPAEPQRADTQAQNASKPSEKGREASVQGNLDPRTTQSVPDAAASPKETALTQPGAGQPQTSPPISRERDGNLTATPKREAAVADPKTPTVPPGKPDAKGAPKEAVQVDPAKAGEPAQSTPTLASLPGSAPANAPASNAGAAPAALERIANMAAVGEIPMVGSLPGLRPAVLAGEPAAVYEMAARAAEGRGMARDLKLAAKLFEKAAAHGLVPAQYRIGNFYEKGLGVTRDLALAKQWYQRAAEKGNAKAMHNLAVLLAEGAGAKPDYAAAIEWFRRGAEHGVRDSQFNLAVLQARGLGTGQDLAGAYTWFSIAAQQGDEDAAKKRDEVGARMAQADLATAKSAVERWRVPSLDPVANEVALPGHGWSEAPAKKAAGGGPV